VKNYEPRYYPVPGTATDQENCVGFVVRNKWPAVGGGIYEDAQVFYDNVLKKRAQDISNLWNNNPSDGDIAVFFKDGVAKHVALVTGNSPDPLSANITSKDNQESVVRGVWVPKVIDLAGTLTGRNRDPIVDRNGSPTFYRMKPGVTLSPSR
jgi:hypothetical protein